MHPYFSAGPYTIYHGDCRDGLLELPQVDAVVTDPPYEETTLEWDKHAKGWANLAASLTRSMWVFGSLQMFINKADEFPAWKRSQEIIWEKHNGSSMHADRFKRVHEIAVHFYLGAWADVYKQPVMTPDAVKRRIRRRERPAHFGDVGESTYESEDGGLRFMRSVIYARSCHGTAWHPTQKPLAILLPLIQYSVPPGGLVLDPFMGSGSTLLAANSLGVRSIGIEVEERFCEIAAKRLSQQLLNF